MKSRQEVSAGGMVYRRRQDTVEILICKAASYHRWVLPKGLVRKNEAIEETALREVEEETGVRARIVASLGEPEKYIYAARGVRVFKYVHYFLMEYESGSETVHDAEMEEVRWVTIDAAIELLAYKSAQDVVKRGQSALFDL